MAEVDLDQYLADVNYLEDIRYRIIEAGRSRAPDRPPISSGAARAIDRAELDADALEAVEGLLGAAWESSDDPRCLDLGLLMPLAAGACSGKSLSPPELVARCRALVDELDLEEI